MKKITDTELFRLFTEIKPPTEFLTAYDNATGKRILNRQRLDWIKEVLETFVLLTTGEHSEVKKQEQLEECILVFLLLNEYITEQERLPHKTQVRFYCHSTSQVRLHLRAPISLALDL
ncbi:MAG: hypothetical protein LBE12_04590 [Planctomycetaceae bacterium]|jgi:hypothetical protein|nr:hypothetical protein [Planctomycetaceae bacterium]